MNLPCTVFLLAALLVAGTVARAAPPTVTPSPGYDARLQEQHKAASTSSATSTVVQPVNPPSVPPRRHHARRTH